MPYAKRTCDVCGRAWKPDGAQDGQTCRQCLWIERGGHPAGGAIAARPERAQRRACETCQSEYWPPANDPTTKRCPACRKLSDIVPAQPFADFVPKGQLPQGPTHHLSPPLRQGVFDLETFGLDRGWGVLMVGSILIHDGNSQPTTFTFDLTESPKWPDKRSDDSDLAARIFQQLTKCHVLYAHNGVKFDIPYLNSIALKYGLPRLVSKIIDPVWIARKKYRIGNNSLGAVAEFLGLPESKMPVSKDTWRTALMDNEPGAWKILRERCESDVRLLNAVAGHVTADAGMIDAQGSWR